MRLGAQQISKENVYKCVRYFFSIFPSPDQEVNATLMPAAHSTGGSLPDLTNIQFPPPLPTPLDPDDPVTFPAPSTSSSTGNLTTNLTHLGISAASHVAASTPAPAGPALTLNIDAQQQQPCPQQLSPTLSPTLSPQMPISQVSYRIDLAWCSNSYKGCND